MENSYVSGKMTREILMELLERRAGEYTPQWRLDWNHPDLGTALASVFATMQYDTVKEYERLPQKLKIEFFNSIETAMRSASPARGYCVFGLVNDEAKGIELPAGSALTADVTDSSGQKIPVETTQDVFISPSKIKVVYESYNKKDYIGCLYQWQETDKDMEQSMPIFAFEGENLQQHQFFIGHSGVFDICHGAEITLSLFERVGQPVDIAMLERLLSKKKVVFEYSTTDGFVPFAEQRIQGRSLCFVKKAIQPEWVETELSGVLSHWLRMTVTAADEIKHLVLRDMLIAGKGALLVPESIYAGNMDVGKGTYFPFGEQFGVYDEIYVSSDEALNKKGAIITLSFWREYVKIPLGYRESDEINWKLIMPKNNIKVEREYDITIERIIWEYYNGSGWVRLFQGKEFEDVFNGTDGSFKQKCSIVFICPRDLGRVLVNGGEHYYIRARILKVNNSFKTTGQYISPVLSETYFEYYYPNQGVRPERMLERNNRKEQLQIVDSCLGKLYGYSPVSITEDEKPTLYIGFQEPLNRGPNRILAMIEAGNQDNQPHLKWEYYGGGRFKEFHPIDETRNLGQTGLITFNGFPDMQKTVFYGSEYFWLRVTDETERMYQETRSEKPWLKGLYMNAATVQTVHSGLEEFLSVGEYGEKPVFTLLNKSLYEAKVWVNETGKISDRELALLREEKRLREVRDADGNISELWVCWKEVENFLLEQDERQYMLNRNEGILEFRARGSKGFPGAGMINGIHVLYSVCTGEAGNLEIGQITGMELSVGFINRVENPLPLSGGVDRESSYRAMERRAHQIRHRNRAVTTEDFEKMALAASGAISRAACFRGYGEHGEQKPGHVSLVVLQKDFQNSSLYFQQTREDLMEFMKDKIPANLVRGNRFHIARPVFVEIQISVDIIVDEFQQIFSCRNRVLAQLSAFFDPVKGNFGNNGWAVGMLPKRSQIDILLKNTEEVKEIGNLIITGFIRNGRETIEINPEETDQNPYVLPQNGEHRIIVHTE